MTSRANTSNFGLARTNMKTSTTSSTNVSDVADISETGSIRPQQIPHTKIPKSGASVVRSRKAPMYCTTSPAFNSTPGAQSDPNCGSRFRVLMTSEDLHDENEFDSITSLSKSTKPCHTRHVQFGGGSPLVKNESNTPAPSLVTCIGEQSVNLEYSDAANILKNPANYPISYAPAIRPRGGQMFLFSTQGDSNKLSEFHKI